MKRNMLTIFGMLAVALMLTSCMTREIKSGREALVVRILPQGDWQTSKIFLNNQYVDTAVPGADRREFRVAPGRYNVRLETDNHEICKETVTIVDGMEGRNYFEFHPQRPQIRKK